MADQQRNIWINFKGSVSNLMASTKSANDMIGKVGAGVLNIGKGLTSALGGNFQPLIKSAVGAVTSFAKVLTLMPSFLIALVNPLGIASIAMTGFSDAISAASPEAYLAATRNMAPAMVAAVQAVRLLEPELKNLYGIIEQGFWTGFSTDVNELAATYFPILDSGLGSIGTTLGNLREELVQFLLQPQVVATIQNWITAFGTWFQSLLPLIQTAMPTLISLFQSMGNIMEELLPVVTTLIGWFTDILNFIAPILSGLGSISSTAGAVTTGSGSTSTGGSSGSGSTTTKSGGFFSTLISDVGSFFSGLFGKAGGGAVLGGQSYIVGERGPEILSMSGASAGNITPNQGGHTFVNVKIGETDLNDIISHQVTKSNRSVAVASRMGRGLMR